METAGPLNISVICANVRSGIQLQLCCRRPEGKIYSGTGMHSLREQKESAMVHVLVLVFNGQFRGHKTMQGSADLRFVHKNEPLFVTNKLFQATVRVPLTPVHL